MNILGRVTVRPHLPEKIQRLSELAHNLYWSYSPEARALFRRLDRELWEQSGHNPVALLRDISQEKLEQAAQDTGYQRDYQSVLGAFDEYLSGGGSWFESSVPQGHDHVYAYFCAEYGWHESVALYSGGLGILAGDHTKAASDLGVPLVGVGLWYPEGYFHQRVAADGQQEAVYERRGPLAMPLELARDAQGREARTTVSIGGNEVHLRAWRARIGRVPVYLLDTDVPENSPGDRELLTRLYGGDQTTRIAQEIVLGIGGVRMLRALGISPTTWHMNEGHSAFMALERCRELVEAGQSFEVAREVVRAGTVFTVHTPVPAGNDVFPFELVGESFSGYWTGLGLNQGQFFDLAGHDHGWGRVFSMPALALRFSTGRNGVAKLHGETSRRIWNDLWPEVPAEEVPIGHITNGVHAPTWVAPEIRELTATALPADWRARFDEAGIWQAVRGLDNGSLWEVRKSLKAQSVRFLRRRVLRQQARHGASPTAMHDTGELLDAAALTIGFARRFATYKRATLIFHDLDRLENILRGTGRPVQLVFSGKAHPADKPGQELISRIHQLSQDRRFKGRILFVEDYDMAVGRALTRGVDVWLNNPRRPLEASGTSGQKAAMNGVLNLSILDGWWPEGFDGENGWAIGSGRNLRNDDAADAADADALYDLLEREVVPLYYDRDAGGVPQGWMDRVKDAIATITPGFNARRMVREYVGKYYAPASERTRHFASRDGAAAKELAEWRARMQRNWPGIYFSAKPVKDCAYNIGDELHAEAVLNARQLSFEELRVELVYSLEEHALERGLHVVAMSCVEHYPDGGCLFRACFRPEISGRLAYGMRVYPVHEDLVSPFDAGLIRWA